METDKITVQKHLHFLILLPHRDSQNIIEDYRQKLFCHGFFSAYSFPVAAPLAILSRPLKTEELKKIASQTRNITLQKHGKIAAESLDLVFCPDMESFPKLGFYGPLLDISLIDILNNVSNNIIFSFPKTILTVALAKEDNMPAAPAFKPFNFSAARIANLSIRPILSSSALAAKSSIAVYSFEWRVSRGVWLPGYRREMRIES